MIGGTPLPALPVGDAVAAFCQRAGCDIATVNHVEVMLQRHCREGRKGRTALCFEGRTYSYGEVAQAAARCSGWLRAVGIEPGECVILSMPDCPALAAAYFGIVASGAVAILIDPALPSEDAFHVAQLCQARLTIAHEGSAERVLGLRFLPRMISVVQASSDWIQPSEFASAIASHDAGHSIRRNPSGHAYGLLSSGSTGRPKLIVHRHQDILHGYFGFALDVLALNPDDRVISVAKMTTGYGFGGSLLMPFLQGASSALVSGPPRPALLAEALHRHHCTILLGQPRFVAEAVAFPELATKFETLRLAITGGEPLANALADRWNQFSSVELLDSYGNTEIGFLYICNRPGESRRGSVGRPIEGLRVEVVDEAGRVVSPGQIGKLRVRGPSLIDGYWNEPTRSVQSFQEGWFTTSDMFSIDADGYYFIHGRSDHLIKLGCGDWVNPIEIEAVLLEHPSVRECAVVGSPDDRGLTVLKAVVVADARPTDKGVAGELIDMVRERWPALEYKHLGTVEFAAALPKTAAGKLDRAQLHPQSMTEFSYKC